MMFKIESHNEYQAYVVRELSLIAETNPELLLEYADTISKAYILDLDNLVSVIKPLYSETGRPSTNQLEIFRAFVVMTDLHLSIDEWIDKVKYNRVLQIICGFRDTLPGVASYYDFIDRIMPLDERPEFKAKKRKPTKKYKKGEKMPPKHPNITARLVEQALKGRRFDNRPEKVLQEIFAKVSVEQSVKLGLIDTNVSVSGDGTCVNTGASHFGVKKCECVKQGNYNCDCPRKFSDPNATWGWDSHNQCYFYGYTGYFISTHNKSLHIDLPLYLRFVQANRHDSVSAIVAIAELLDLYPDFTINTFISDSASDNAATYELLYKWNINSVIALSERGNFKYPPYLNLDENGIPICMGGNKMVYWGFCPDRERLKFRCPLVLGKISECNCTDSCSPSPYGRTVYTYPKWDFRLFTTIPRGSDEWKLKMNSRTASERINNRILNDYGLNQRKSRGKKRISFFATVAAVNIHLDAQLQVLSSDNRFDFSRLFYLQSPA